MPVEKPINTLRNARAVAEDLARRATDPAAAAFLARYAARIGAFACLAANAKNVIMYQYALDVADQPQTGRTRWTTMITSPTTCAR